MRGTLNKVLWHYTNRHSVNYERGFIYDAYTAIMYKYILSFGIVLDIKTPSISFSYLIPLPAIICMSFLY